MSMRNVLDMLVVGVKTYVALLVNVPGVAAAASQSDLVVVPGTSGSAPAQVPALSSHAASVPAHATPSQVPSGILRRRSKPILLPLVSTRRGSPSILSGSAYVAVLVNVPGVIAAASHNDFVVVPGTSGDAPAQVPAVSSHAA